MFMIGAFVILFALIVLLKYILQRNYMVSKFLAVIIGVGLCAVLLLRLDELNSPRTYGLRILLGLAPMALGILLIRTSGPFIRRIYVECITDMRDKLNKQK